LWLRNQQSSFYKVAWELLPGSEKKVGFVRWKQGKSITEEKFINIRLPFCKMLKQRIPP
jgi:hypothetical protein